jgi:hypothetical protein
MAMEARSKVTFMFWDEVTSQEINLTQRITRTWDSFVLKEMFRAEMEVL